MRTFYKLSIHFILMAAATLSSGTAGAADQPTSACSTIASARDLLRCALERHPIIQQAMIGNQRASNAEGKASAFSNPEISTKTTYGKSLGDHLWTFEGSVDQKLEIGGKRSSRMEMARAEAERGTASLQEAREKAFLEIVHTLNRHRQIHEELEIIDEAISAFQRVQSLYKNRGRLSAEQEVSSEIFSLALGQHRLRRSKLISEKEGIKKRLTFILGQDLPVDEAYLPAFRKEWPELPDSSNDSFESSTIKLAKSDLKSAEAEWNAARAESWPDLTVGPVFQWDREGASDVYRYGFNLSLPLPLWNLNRSGRAYAEQGKNLAVADLEITRKMERTERAQLLEEYRSVTSIIGSLVNLKDLEKKHSRVERLFEQGLVSTSLYIEAHRQIQEYLATRNEEEHEATDALWKIYAIDGRMFEEALWTPTF